MTREAILKVAVLGGGNGSFAAAGDLTLAGHEVRLWRRNAADAKIHLAQGSTITVVDRSGRREARLASVTHSIADALDGADLVLCPAPAFAQPDIANLAAPHLRDGQVVFLPPGTFGSYIFAGAAREAGNRAEIATAETGTLPWLARKQGPYVVRISGRGARLPTGVFPSRLATHALGVIEGAFPNAVEACGDALSAALMNAGPIIHPPLITMNAGPIEHFDKWDIHKEGTQPAIRRVTDALDAERIAIREALGYRGPHFPLADHYSRDGEPWMYQRDAHDQLTDSGDWSERLVLTQHRYMLEDLRLGLSFLASVANLAGVQVPLVKAFLAIGSAITGEDFVTNGRTLSSLGLGHLDRSALQHLLAEGFR
jgi:opine dehydrogenase